MSLHPHLASTQIPPPGHLPPGPCFPLPCCTTGPHPPLRTSSLGAGGGVASGQELPEWWSLPPVQEGVPRVMPFLLPGDTLACLRASPASRGVCSFGPPGPSQCPHTAVTGTRAGASAGRAHGGHRGQLGSLPSLFPPPSYVNL